MTGKVKGLTFGEALEILKGGSIVTRDGWNGRGMHLSLEKRPGDMSRAEKAANKWQPFIVLHTAQGTLVPWTPSQTDVLAEDWWRAI